MASTARGLATHGPRTVAKVVVGVLVAGLGVACSGDGGDVEAFRDAWEEAQALMPDQATLESDPQACTDALGAVRTAREELPPAPDPPTRDVADEWFRIAEATLFDCPPQGDAIDGFDDAYRQLAETAEAVDAELAVRE